MIPTGPHYIILSKLQKGIPVKLTSLQMFLSPYVHRIELALWIAWAMVAVCLAVHYLVVPLSKRLAEKNKRP